MSAPPTRMRGKYCLQMQTLPGQPLHCSAPHGIEVAVEFKPVEHPTEPFDSDQPIQCPLPEPSILNDSPGNSEIKGVMLGRLSDEGLG
ncbi:hypothetical protein GH714_005354 [Hevea brasiliensis]|uniref:Uncharacterized protein n=1 Tax=Hevea brasiliensis TaxID=3981 RepID=A0A6A6LYJ0_HEVBR|nr:hypothetical protein GH714_005354 [Hevea brasiliensis]